MTDEEDPRRVLRGSATHTTRLGTVTNHCEMHTNFIGPLQDTAKCVPLSPAEREFVRELVRAALRAEYP